MQSMEPHVAPEFLQPSGTEEEDSKLADMELEAHDGTWERRETVDDELKLVRSKRAGRGLDDRDLLEQQGSPLHVSELLVSQNPNSFRIFSLKDSRLPQ